MEGHFVAAFATPAAAVDGLDGKTLSPLVLTLLLLILLPEL